MSTTKPYDIVVFGATSFVGEILCRYLLQDVNEPELKWAIAGRSQAKLDKLLSALSSSNSNPPPTLIADADNEQSLLALCDQTRVVISTVGPYALYGEKLIAACVKTGTDYCDLTGETQWMKRMINRYEEAARESGARIVHCCGFDSIPSDLGVYYCQQQAHKRFGHYCKRIKMRVKSMSGGVSGGTVASMINGVKEAIADPAIRKQMSDPYSLCPESHTYQGRQQNPSFEYDNDLDSWAGPFIMAAINTRVVFRSNALTDYIYGMDFRYDEATLTGRGSKGRRRARQLYWGTTLFGAAVSVPPIRWLLEKFVLPKPGEGPSLEKQTQGNYQLEFVGHTADGLMIKTRVEGDRDPGYGSTGKMLAQAGLCLAFDVYPDQLSGGFWTPATAFNDKLIQRLESFAGIKFSVIE